MREPQIAALRSTSVFWQGALKTSGHILPWGQSMEKHAPLRPA